MFVPGNIVDWAQLTSCFKAAIERVGEIDIVVANAGIMESSPVLDVFLDENGDSRENTEAGRVIDVNVMGTLNSMVPISSPWLLCLSSTGLWATLWSILTRQFRVSPSTRLFYMKQPRSTTCKPKSIVLVGSTSSYFGGTISIYK
jgi:NAD(P)-dependent dehydrogenase (short-subunit alcohol dehydrogenase family)